MNITLFGDTGFVRRFYRLTVINSVFHMVEPLCGAVSLSFLGHLDALDPLIGVSYAAPLFSGLYGIATFLRIGTTGMVAQAMGRDNPEQMALVGLRNGLIALTLSGVILLLHGPLGSFWFIHSFNGELSTQSSALNYFQSRIWGTPAVLINLVLIGWLLGCQKSGSALMMSLIGHSSTIALDYIFIVRCHWASTGAGMAQALSQYLILLLGVWILCREIGWSQLYSSVKQIWEASALRSSFFLNSNTFIRSLCNNISYVLFFILSDSIGSNTLAENTLLIQISSLAVYFFEGIGFTVEALVGNFEGQGTKDKLRALLTLSLSTGLAIGLGAMVICILFPHQIFALLTHHQEILELIPSHVAWLFLFSGAIATYTILDAYFAGLARADVLRNASLCGIAFGFLPFAGIAYYFHSNHLLWFAMSFSLMVKSAALGFYLRKQPVLKLVPSIGNSP